MRIVVAGGSGFLGSHLRTRLRRDGHDLVQLVRRPPAAADQRRWDPGHGTLDPSVLAGADVVINLAGAGVEDRRWNAAYKKVLWSSRVDTTATVAAAIGSLPDNARPGVLLNASGVGFYGDTGDTTVDETSPPGRGFFPELCLAWEAATQAAAQSGTRVVFLRSGLVLDARGGLLKPLSLLFRLFAGGKLGNGRQWMPWISMADWLAATTFLLTRPQVAGPVNMVGPTPARNVDFTRALARAVHRPAIIPAPKLGLRIVLGEFAHEALASQRALPGVLERAGFTFSHADLDSALRDALH